MPLFGAHMSIAGGCHKAIEDALAHQCDTVQLFTKNASQWIGKPLAKSDVSVFREALSKSGLRYATAHDSYLINLATQDEALYRKSLEAFVDEMQRAEALGLSYLVMHPGAHMGAGEEAGLARVSQALDEIHARCPTFNVMILIEATAGQGTTLGHRFEHLAAILDGVAKPERLGVCLDTCHIFAAGYPLFPKRDYQATLREFDRIVGLERLKLFHVNDSMKPLGCRVDRHAHIGKGEIGLEAFRLLVNDRRFRDYPMILETPKEDDMDAVNLATLRSLVKSRSARKR